MVAGPVSAVGADAIILIQSVKIARNGVLTVRGTKCDCDGVVALRRAVDLPAPINRLKRMCRPGRREEEGILVEKG